MKPSATPYHIIFDDWFDEYRSMIRWTDGHSLRDIVYEQIDPFPKWRVMAVKAQVELLADLHADGLLK